MKSSKKNSKRKYKSGYKSDEEIKSISTTSFKKHITNDYNHSDSYINRPVTPLGEGQQYAIAKHARRQENKIAEIAAAIGAEDITDLLTFSIERVMYQEVAALSKVYIKHRDKNDFNEIFHKIYTKFIRTNEIKKWAESSQQQIDSEIENTIEILFGDPNLHQQSDLSKKYQSLYDEIVNIINDRESMGLYNRGDHSFSVEDVNEVKKRRVFDVIYNDIVTERVRSKVKSIILDILSLPEVEAIKYSGLEAPIQSQTRFNAIERENFMIIGAPGSGKSTLFEKIIRNKNGFFDVVYNNTDEYRDIVSHPSELGPDPIPHAEFNGDEAYIIRKKVDQILAEEIRNDFAPNVIIDTVYPDQERIDFLVFGGSELNLCCITISTEAAKVRMFSRGKETDRYVNTQYLEEMQQNISRDFHCILQQNSGKKIYYKLYNNDVEKGKEPILIEEGDLYNHEVRCFSPDLAKEFVDRGSPSGSRTSKSQSPEKILSSSPYKELAQANFDISVVNPIYPDLSSTSDRPEPLFTQRERDKKAFKVSKDSSFSRPK